MMMFFLKNSKNENIVEVELWKEDDYLEIKSVVNINEYSELLINNNDNATEIIEDFDKISQLKRWLWHNCYQERIILPLTERVSSKLRLMLENIAKKYDLRYSEKSNNYGKENE